MDDRRLGSSRYKVEPWRLIDGRNGREVQLGCFGFTEEREPQDYLQFPKMRERRLLERFQKKTVSFLVHSS